MLESLVLGETHQYMYNDWSTDHQCSRLECEASIGILGTTCSPRAVMSWNKMRPMMVATSDDDTVLTNDASQKYRRGFWSFAKNNWLSFASSLAGLTCVVGIITFTFWLSRQHFNCPSWAADCTVMPTVAWIKDHFGLVQGIVTLIYSIGLSALASSGHTMAEAAIWLLLTKQPFSLNQMDTYLSASRGSTISILSSLGFVKTWETGLALSCAGMVAVLTLLASLDVGFVYAQQNQTVLYNSILAVGGGEGRLFQQTNPPNSLLADSANFYSSWARNMSTEPMPQYRDWYIDRQVLSERGNMTINAVKFNKNVSCSGTSLTRAPSGNFTFLTDMSGHNRTHGEESDKTVALRSYPYLLVWAANYMFPSTNCTRAELIFTALNGTIQGGTWTELQNVEHILAV
jgi:hypothetical protein